MKGERMLWPWERRLSRDIVAWLNLPRAPFAATDRIVLPATAVAEFDRYMKNTAGRGAV